MATSGSGSRRSTSGSRAGSGDDRGPAACKPLKAEPRYAALTHPGDAYCYGIFTAVVDALTDRPLNDLD